MLEGSLFLDGGISVADHVFGDVLFKDTPELLHVWTYLPQHPLQVAINSISVDDTYQLSLKDSFANRFGHSRKISR